MRLAFCSLIGAMTVSVGMAADAVSTRDLQGNAATPVFVDTPASRIDAKSFPAGHGGLRSETCAADWSTLGLFGGDAQDVAASPTVPNVVLCGTAPASGFGGTLFRSTDGGATWAPVPTLANISVYDIEFASDGTVYIGTIDSVWKSTNNGVSFTQLNLNIGLNDQVFVVKVDPNNSMVLWCGVADALGAQPVNVMRSPDAGGTWFNRTPNLASPQSCRGIAINPTNSDRLFAVFGGGFGGGQVWTTGNSGTGWTNRTLGLPSNPMNDAFHDGNRILVCGGQLFGSQNVGLYTSDNNGQNWTALHAADWPTRVINDIQVDPTNPLRILLATAKGVFESTNGGINWSFGVGGTSGFSTNSVRIDPLNSSNVFLGVSSAGVVRSTNGGASYAQSSTGIQQLNTVSVAANPTNDQDLAIAFEGLNDGGVFTSNDGGASWSLASVPATRWNTVGYATDGTLYAISDGPTTIAPEALYRRNPDNTWTSIGPNQGTLFESELFSMTFSANTPDLIVAGGSDFGVAGSEATIWVYRTATGWQKTYEGIPNQAQDVLDVEILQDGSDMNMVACYVDFASPQIGGALRSVNGGGSWVPATNGLNAARQGFALCQSPTDPQTVYYADGGSPGGVYVSTDSGQNWNSTGYVAPVRGLECDENNDAILYAMRADATKVYASCDSGASFAPFNAGIDAAAGFPQTLRYAGGANPRLLLATNTGPYVTAACGATACPQPGCEVGDLDGDCAIGLQDLAFVLSSYGQPEVRPEDGDFDKDGDVDIEDLALILSLFGQNCQ